MVHSAVTDDASHVDRAEIRIEILDFQRPFAGEGVLQAAGGGPSDLRVSDIVTIATPISVVAMSFRNIDIRVGVYRAAVAGNADAYERGSDR
jgi:hypothetical protein